MTLPNFQLVQANVDQTARWFFAELKKMCGTEELKYHHESWSMIFHQRKSPSSGLPFWISFFTFWTDQDKADKPWDADPVSTSHSQPRF